MAYRDLGSVPREQFGIRHRVKRALFLKNDNVAVNIQETYPVSGLIFAILVILLENLMQCIFRNVACLSVVSLTHTLRCCQRGLPGSNGDYVGGGVFSRAKEQL